MCYHLRSCVPKLVKRSECPLEKNNYIDHRCSLSTTYFYDANFYNRHNKQFSKWFMMIMKSHAGIIYHTSLQTKLQSTKIYPKIRVWTRTNTRYADCSPNLTSNAATSARTPRTAGQCQCQSKRHLSLSSTQCLLSWMAPNQMRKSPCRSS